MIMQPRELLDAYIAALSAREYEQARGFLADAGFEYTSPIASFNDADDFMEYTMLMGGIVHSISTRKVFVDGADVCHFLVFCTQIAEREQTSVAQWSRVEGGRIRRIEVLFDAHQYKVMFPVSSPDGDA
jgi:hypothetical protein